MSYILRVHRPKIVCQYDEEQNKTINQNKLIDWNPNLDVVRAMGFGEGLDIAAA